MAFYNNELIVTDTNGNTRTYNIENDNTAIGEAMYQASKGNTVVIYGYVNNVKCSVSYFDSEHNGSTMFL